MHGEARGSAVDMAAEPGECCFYTTQSPPSVCGGDLANAGARRGQGAAAVLRLQAFGHAVDTAQREIGECRVSIPPLQPDDSGSGRPWCKYTTKRSLRALIRTKYWRRTPGRHIPCPAALTRVGRSGPRGWFRLVCAPSDSPTGSGSGGTAHWTARCPVAGEMRPRPTRCILIPGSGNMSGRGGLLNSLTSGHDGRQAFGMPTGCRNIRRGAGVVERA